MDDLGRSMATEISGNEPKDETSPPPVLQAPGQASPSEEGEEGRRSKGLSAPMKVSKEEREEHERTHTHHTGHGVRPVCGRGAEPRRT